MFTTSDWLFIVLDGQDAYSNEIRIWTGGKALLNTEDEPENENYPSDPEFAKKFGPRGVIHSLADGKIEDTGPLNMKRMETVDGEFLAGALDFIDRANAADKPFFVWFNSTRMHVWTRLKAESKGVTGQGIYADGMVEHDGMVGQLLEKLDEQNPL